MDENLRREDLAVHVRRDNVFEDSFRELHRRTPEEWKNRFYIVFEGEEGQDVFKNNVKSIFPFFGRLPMEFTEGFFKNLITTNVDSQVFTP